MTKKDANNSALFKMIATIILAAMLMGAGFLWGQAYISRKNTANSNSNTFPEGWTMKIEDNTYCHDVRVWSMGRYEGTIEEYVKNEILDNRIEVVLKDTPYSLDSFPDTMSIQPTEPGITSLIYFKSHGGIVYSLIVYDSKESPNKEECLDLNSLVPNLIEMLI